MLSRSRAPPHAIRPPTFRSAIAGTRAAEPVLGRVGDGARGHYGVWIKIYLGSKIYRIYVSITGSSRAGIKGDEDTMRHHNQDRRDGSRGSPDGGPHAAGHHHHGRHRGERRFARDPLEPGERFGGRDRQASGHHHHGGGRRRLFDHGDLRFILLSMIAARPAHGYDLIKALEDRMGGGYSPSPGVIYPTLTLLEEQGFASVTAEAGKKLYQVTPEGQAFLAANQTSVDVIQARIDGLARERSVVPDPRIIRAIENLKTALRLRLAGGAIPDEQVRAIAAAIDAAAMEAERV
jgi:DNA-binding PadR family transcriptional regulator